MILSKREYYPWYQRYISSPWKRFLNKDYLKSEIKRIEETKAWKENYRDFAENQSLPEVKFYVIPLKLSSDWMTDIVLSGCEFKGLSCLYNDIQIPFIALIPKGIKIPEDYSFIQINSSNKKVLLNRKNKDSADAVIINSWEELSAEKIYVDIPAEKKIISKILMSNVDVDMQIANSLQAPLLSSPGIDQLKGISYAVKIGGGFAEGLMKQLQRMLPPELRVASPPEDLKEGQYVEDITGIHYKFAEMPPKSKDSVSSFLSNGYNDIDNANSFRKANPGEFSFMASLTNRRENAVPQMMKKFVSNDITGYYVNRSYESEADLKGLNKEINEDLWINIINARQLFPSLNPANLSLINFQKKITEDWEPHLEEIGYTKEDAEEIKGVYGKKTAESLQRISQSLARASLRDSVNDSDLNRAREIFLDNLNDLSSSGQALDAREKFAKSKNNIRISVIRAIFSGSRPLTESEAWEEAKSHKCFKDLTDFLGAVRWSQEQGILYKISEKGLTLV